jgi:hypothetical protein
VTEAELRGKIRVLMASGAVPSEPPVISGTGDVGAVKYPLLAACSVCGERGPQITLFYVAGRVVRLHAACEALWQQERPGAPDSHNKATGAP